MPLQSLNKLDSNSNGLNRNYVHFTPWHKPIDGLENVEILWEGESWQDVRKFSMQILK